MSERYITCPDCDGRGAVRLSAENGDGSQGETITVCCHRCNPDPTGSGFGVSPETAGRIKASDAMPPAPKPWMKQPGELVDSRGVPIHPGDLLKSFHFRAARRRQKFYLYHTAVYEEGAMKMVPTMHLEPTKAGQGGKCLLSEARAAETTVIHGVGPAGCLDYTDRPRRKRDEEDDDECLT